MTPEREQLLDARLEASWEPELEDFLSEHAHSADCECERCVEDREVF